MAKREAEQAAPAPKATQRPAHEVRLGRIRCAIWENQHEKTGTWYSMTFSRSYRDGGAQGEWKSASSFGRDDLLVLAEVSRQAFHWIHRQYQEARAAGPREPGEEEAEDGDIPF